MTDKEVLILSRKIKARDKGVSEFHFKGFCCGALVEIVELSHSSEAGFETEVDYLLLVRILSFENGILRGELIKHRKLE